MNDRIFLLECSAPVWLKVAAQLEREGRKIVLWSAWRHMQSDINTQFPNTHFVDTVYAKAARQEEGAYPLNHGFDNVCESVWREEAQVVYDMMNRFDHSGDQSFVERSTLFLHHIIYWSERLSILRPDLVVFSSPPHVVYDYIILCLCRRRNILTLMFEEATILPSYSLAMRDYLDEFIYSQDGETVSDEVRSEIKLIVAAMKSPDAGKSALQIQTEISSNEAMARGLAFLTEQRRQVEAFDHAVANGNAKPDPIVNITSLYKEHGKPLQSSFEGDFANTRFMDQKIADFEINQSLYLFYRRLQTPTNAFPEGPYVYYSMAGQPERTSNPQGGIYANQLLAVGLLSAALPQGWHLRVKEHPNQFSPNFLSTACRSKLYYETLAAFPNTYLVDVDIEPRELIDGAKAVATIAGTTALEGVARGKVALCFGDAWYRDTPGVVRVRNLEDVREVIGEIANGNFEVSEGALEDFLVGIAGIGFRGIADYPPVGYSVSLQEIAQSLFHQVMNALETNKNRRA